MSDIAIFVLIVFASIVTPYATLWMLNTLFGLGLAYTFKTWCAALILNWMLTVNVKKN